MSRWAEHVRPRLAPLRLSPGREADVVEELSQHLDDRCRELVEGGMPPDEAARVALADFREGNVLARLMAPLRQSNAPPTITPGVPGGSERTRPTSIHHVGRVLLDPANILADLWQDARYGLRMWRRQPGFTALAIVTLALGIGATAAMLSLVRALYVNALPVEDAARLVQLHQTLEQRPGTLFGEIGLPDYRYYRDRARTVTELAAHYPSAPLHLAIGADTAEIMGSVVTAGYFTTLRLKPQLGRFFLAGEDDVPDRDPVVVIGDEMWRRRFGADTAVLGRTIELNARAFTIVGVAPRAFHGALPGLPRSDVWMPMAMIRVGYRAGCDGFRLDCRIVQALGRLAPGAGVADAQAEMNVLAGQLRAEAPDLRRGRGVFVRPARGVRVQEQETHAPTARLLFAIVIAVLVMACANLAGLLLARNVARRREVAIRLSLGASRPRLLRQFLIESLLLALAGGAGGVLVAVWGNGLLRTSFGSTYVSDDANFAVTLDPIVLGATLALCVAAALAFGLGPAWAAVRHDVAPALKDETSGGSPRSPLRDLLVVAQIAGAVVLLAGAALLLRSIGAVLRGPGVAIDQVVMLRLRPAQAGYGLPESRRYQLEALRRIEALPGVVSASPAAYPPLPDWGPSLPVVKAGTEVSATTRFNVVGSRYFETLGVRVTAGRAFDERERPGTPPVAIVNDTLARRLWPDGGAVGASVVFNGAPHQIVGVVQDAQYAPVGQPSEPMIYTSFWQLPPTHRQMGDSTTHVRVAGDAAAMLARIRQEVASIDRDVAIGDWTLSMRVDEAFRRVRVAGTLAASAGALALFLSATGVFGLLTFAVGQRRREMAIRAALGAGRRDLARLVVRHSARLAALGVAIGLTAAIPAARLLVAMLYGVRPNDPLSLALASAAIAATAAAATWLPARRAMAVDPTAVLKDS